MRRKSLSAFLSSIWSSVFRSIPPPIWRRA
jgi:hypothetical protein